MIVQGTTPRHTITLPIPTASVKCVRFIYSQDGQVRVKKATEDITMDGNNVSVRLTQEDTFSFSTDMRVKLVVRVLTAAGDSLVSDPIYMAVRGCDDCEVLA